MLFELPIILSGNFFKINLRIILLRFVQNIKGILEILINLTAILEF